MDDLVDLTAMIPWWAGVVVAVASYFVLHWLAMPVDVTTAAQRSPADVMRGSLLRALASVGQFLFPILFLIGASISAIQASKRRRILEGTKVEPAWGGAGSGTRNGRELLEIEAGHDAHWKDAPSLQIAEPSASEDRWSLDLLERLEWKRFEYLCAGYFEELEFRAKTIRAGADGGVDIHLFLKDARHPGIVVQCKAWRNVTVGVKVVRELLGVMTADNVGEGIIVTTSTFSDDARMFALGKNIHLIDGKALLAKLLELPPERQESLLQFATDGDYTTPTCPSCGTGTRMRLRTSGRDGSLFWGCANFPRCRTTMHATRSIAG